MTQTLFRRVLLAGWLILTLSAWAYAAPCLGEPPLMPTEEEATLYDGNGVQAASGANLYSGDKDLSKLSRQEIGALLSESPLTLPAELYDVTPSLKSPYAPGKLKAEALQAALRRLNALRRIAGLSPVALDDALNENAQYGAVLLAVSNFAHSPAQPADMDDAFYEKGKEAAASSNIAWGYTLTGAVDGFMDDSDSGNINRLGHRRWQLNPTMGKIGFGYANGRSTEKVFDRSAAAGNYDFVAWPASGNFPAGLLDASQAWSVSLNKSRYSTPVLSDLTLTLRRGSDGKTWTFSGTDSYTAADSGPYFHVDTGNYGVSNCIIFRPDGVQSYDGSYTVTITGLKDKSGASLQAFSYQVNFFDAGAYSTAVVTGVHASPWRTLHLTSAYTDADTLSKLAALLPRSIGVTTEDNRSLSAAVKGDWTLDRTRQRWTASVDVSALSVKLSDPNGLLQSVSVPYVVDAQTGIFTVTPATPYSGAPGQFRLWRYMIGMDAVELYQATTSGGVKRYDQNSGNYSVDAEGYCVFSVDAWTAGDSGDWYAVYYNRDNPGLTDAYLAGGERITVQDNLSLSEAKIVNGVVSVTVNGDPGEGARLYFTAFDVQNRFLRVSVLRDISVAGTYGAAMDLSGAAKVSVFLLDADSRPLAKTR
ncbi:MAG: CAP domain-containing protein [Oscillibacter sp.]|nr:CAP domain-containing protein [Oscillibacter sp.]